MLKMFTLAYRRCANGSLIKIRKKAVILWAFLSFEGLQVSDGTDQLHH